MPLPPSLDHKAAEPPLRIFQEIARLPRRPQSTLAPRPKPETISPEEIRDMDTDNPPDPALIEDLVLANRILADQGVLDGFGHVSARHDKYPDRFLMSQSRAPAAVTTADIKQFELDGRPIGEVQKPPLERFIHSEIFRARPEVMAVVHSHSPAVIPFGVTDVPLRAICHVSAFIGIRAPIFEIRDTAGDDSSLLITSPYLGSALAKALGNAPVVLMRGHGAAMVGGSVRQAVYRAIYTEMNARQQSESMRLGAVNFLTKGEAASASLSIESDLSKPWEHWKKCLEYKTGPGSAG
jgi:ribulose-5-phosphate 4-epimerase/fuculose-1-phosphate aldolase